jgi:hypothetical protein
VGEKGVRGPATPSPAERARTIAARGGRAALLPSGESQAGITPLLHHVHQDGTATILLAADHAMLDAAEPCLPAMLEIADPTPVRLREPVRGLLWLTGWLRVLGASEARAQVLAIAEERPDSRLLDAGHSASVLRLESAALVLADGEGTCPVPPEEFASAIPDPFCQLENGWLRYLDSRHRDVVGKLIGHLPQQLRGGHIRPLGLDRFGLRLRVESVDGDHDVRLAFSGPVSDPERLGIELRRLVGCPFLAQQNQA